MKTAWNKNTTALMGKFSPSNCVDKHCVWSIHSLYETSYENVEGLKAHRTKTLADRPEDLKKSIFPGKQRVLAQERLMASADLEDTNSPNQRSVKHLLLNSVARFAQ
jgi:hypothetical protein